ncbi:MAG: electron transfer flavoprotein subunit beta/FixA family protein [Duodenibacillus sp.]|nr:electron transfer flavoprotein subunit beta/FixA family protein [Duodenibacillus sp.]
MKILVPVKRVVDYNVKVRALPDRSGVDVAAAKMSMNPFDEIAVEAAVRLKEQGKADEVVVVSIGPAKTAETLTVALAMGADRALHVEAEAAPEPLAAARILAAAAEREQPGLIVMGKQAVDDDAAQVPQMLSALLNWPVATCANKIDVADGACTVSRETDAGDMIVRAALPCVVSADLRLAEPRYVTLANKMKARKKKIDKAAAADLAGGAAALVELVEAVDPPARAAGVKLAGVDELIDKLKNAAKAL